MKFIFPFLALIACQPSSYACTVAEIGTKQNVTVAQNLGWFWKMDAGLVVNKRGVSKEGLRINAADAAAKWVSKYGSVSINPVGREFPLGGMNEKGLSVQGLHSYDGRYETTSRLPVLNMFQWVQFQLDTAATVEEAIENARTVRPTDNAQLTLHYFICDSTGKCAVFEWLNGNLEVRDDSTLAVRAFSNSNYEASISELQKCASSDCPLPSDGPNFSLQRFVQAARLVKSYDGVAEPVAYLFNLLDVVKQPQPLASWSIVTRNAGAAFGVPFTMSISSPGSKAIQFVDLREFNFSCSAPAQMQVVDVAQSGNVRGLFKDYDPEMQKMQKRLREYPEKTVCVNP